MEIISAAIESGNPVKFLEILSLLFLVWRVVKPFIEKQVKALVQEMAGQMDSLRSEIKELRKSVEVVSTSLKALETNNQSRFNEHDVRLRRLENGGITWETK